MDFLKERVGLMSTILTTLVVVIGGYLTWQNYEKGKPNLIIEIDSLHLKCNVNPKDIARDLQQIEDEYGRVTADRINVIIANAKMTNYYNFPQVDSLLAKVYDAIDQFQIHQDSWGPNKITYYNNGIIRWPDDTPFDFVHDDKAGKLFPDEYQIVRRNPKSVPQAVIRKIQNKAFFLYQPFGEEGNSKRIEVANKLRIVRSKLEDIRDVGSYYLEVKLTVINKSTQPNLLEAVHALIIKNHPKLELRPINTESRYLGPLGIYRITSRSKGFKRMTDLNAADLLQSFQSEFNFTIHLPDLDENRWETKASFNNGSIGIPTNEGIASR